MTPPSEVRIDSPYPMRATESPRLRACSTKCQSGGCQTGSFSLLSTVRRPRGVSNFQVLAPPSFTSVLPLPVATWVVNIVSGPFFSQTRFSSRLTTRYGLSFGGSAFAASCTTFSACSPVDCTTDSRSPRLSSATMRMTLRSNRLATRVSTNSQVESAVSSIMPPTRYQATPPPWPKKRTARSVSPPVVIVIPTYGSPSIEIHRHPDFENFFHGLEVRRARADRPRHHVLRILQGSG